MQQNSYRQLDAEKTFETLKTLQKRITERFGDSSLARVAGELSELATETRSRIEWIERPHLGLRIAVVVVIAVSVILAGYGINEMLGQRVGKLSVADKIGLLDSMTNEVIIAGAAVAFLVSLELRAKRTRAVQTLHDLRAIAHVIDMHQLTKDPSQILNARQSPTQSSPKRVLTPFELTRYLDYCTEMLSLVGKLAALYAQSLSDPTVVAAVNDIETLTNGLSRKIWQKIVMLDDVARMLQRKNDDINPLESAGLADQTPARRSDNQPPTA